MQFRGSGADTESCNLHHQLSVAILRVELHFGLSNDVEFDKPDYDGTPSLPGETTTSARAACLLAGYLLYLGEKACVQFGSRSTSLVDSLPGGI